MITSGCDVEVEVRCPVTSPSISYDQFFTSGSRSSVVRAKSNPSKMLGVLRPLVLASSFAATASTISLPSLPVAEATRLSSPDVAPKLVETPRRISLRQAREIAMAAHLFVEAGLREDRAQEARWMKLSVTEDELADA
jgi:hypothetical protein